MCVHTTLVCHLLSVSLPAFVHRPFSFSTFFRYWFFDCHQAKSSGIYSVSRLDPKHAWVQRILSPASGLLLLISIAFNVFISISVRRALFGVSLICTVASCLLCSICRFGSTTTCVWHTDVFFKTNRMLIILYSRIFAINPLPDRSSEKDTYGRRILAREVYGLTCRDR